MQTTLADLHAEQVGYLPSHFFLRLLQKQHAPVWYFLPLLLIFPTLSQIAVDAFTIPFFGILSSILGPNLFNSSYYLFIPVLRDGIFVV